MASSSLYIYGWMYLLALLFLVCIYKCVYIHVDKGDIYIHARSLLLVIHKEVEALPMCRYNNWRR